MKLDRLGFWASRRCRLRGKRSRAIMVCSVLATIGAIAVLADVVTSEAMRPNASSYAHIAPSFLAAGGWQQFQLPYESGSRSRQWRNDRIEVPTAIGISVNDYHSVLVAMAEFRLSGSSRPGGGEWQDGVRIAADAISGSVSGSGDVAGWETACDSSHDACGAYRFRVRYANVIATISIVSVSRIPPIRQRQALGYLASVTAAEADAARR